LPAEVVVSLVFRHGLGSRTGVCIQITTISIPQSKLHEYEPRTQEGGLSDVEEVEEGGGGIYEDLYEYHLTIEA
jgi:hypothetical protein